MCITSGKGNLTTAIEYDFKALEIYKELKDSVNIGNSYFRIGSLKYFINKDSNMSKMDIINTYNLKAETLYKKIKAYKELNKLYRQQFVIYKQEVDAYKEKEDYKKALEFHEDYTSVLESYLVQKHKEEIEIINKEMELEKKQIREAEQEKRELFIIYFSIGIIALLLVIAFLIYRLSWHTSKGKNEG
ncbi:MAG: hypothetical protein WC121_14450 [Candidatus Kapaibacterium sp.]